MPPARLDHLDRKEVSGRERLQRFDAGATCHGLGILVRVHAWAIRRKGMPRVPRDRIFHAVIHADGRVWRWRDETRLSIRATWCTPGGCVIVHVCCGRIRRTAAVHVAHVYALPDLRVHMRLPRCLALLADSLCFCACVRYTQLARTQDQESARACRCRRGSRPAGRVALALRSAVAGRA